MRTFWKRLAALFTIKSLTVKPALDKAMEETVMYLGVVATPKARIEPVGHQYGLFDAQNGALVGTYSRARDAKRGAKRRGFVVA